MAAQALAVNGDKVYICGRTEEKLDNVVETYGKYMAGELIAILADVRRKDEVRRLVDEISSREKCLCILVNNAGVSRRPLTTETSSAGEMKSNLFETDKTTMEDWTSTYETNVASVFFVTAAFLPLLQRSSELHEHWSAAVVNITSISGLVMAANQYVNGQTMPVDGGCQYIFRAVPLNLAGILLLGLGTVVLDLLWITPDPHIPRITDLGY